MSWIDDTMSAVAAAASTASTAQAGDPQVYMGSLGPEQISVTSTTSRPLTPAEVRRSGPSGMDTTLRPPKRTSNTHSAVRYPDDIRTVDEAKGQVLAWHGTSEFDRWGKRLLGLGLIDPGDETSVEILDAVWQDAVDLAARFLASGKKVTPWKAAELMAQSGTSGGGSRYGSSGGTFTGTRSSTKPSVDLTDPETAKAITNDALSRALGRAARPEEAAQFLQVINSAEKSNPTLTTTNTRYDKGVEVGGSSIRSGGVTDAGRTQMVTDQAQEMPEYGAYQAASTYFNAMVDALGSPV